MAAVFKLEFKATDLEATAEKLGLLETDRLNTIAVAAVNEVAKRAYTLGRAEVLRDINLPESYVDERLKLREALDASRPLARIVAPRQDDPRPPTLTRYGAQVLMAPVNWPNGSFKAGAMGKNPRAPGRRLPWKPRKGNPSIGVPVNEKAVGFTVNVTKAKASIFSRSDSGSLYSFIIRAANGERLTVTRHAERNLNSKGNPKFEVLRGPSVWQLFRATVPKIFSTVEKDLRETINNEINKTVESLL